MTPTLIGVLVPPPDDPLPQAVSASRTPAVKIPSFRNLMQPPPPHKCGSSLDGRPDVMNKRLPLNKRSPNIGSAPVLVKRGHACTRGAVFRSSKGGGETSKGAALSVRNLPEEAELWPGAGDSTRKLLLAALAAFAQRGYHGTTTRHIAERAEVSAAAIYTYYKSKSELLYQLSWAGYFALLREMQAVLARSATPVQRLRKLVRAHVRFHARMHTLARVANYELHSLDAENRRAIVEIRDEMEAIMREAIRLGTESGAFDVPDLELATVSL